MLKTVYINLGSLFVFFLSSLFFLGAWQETWNLLIFELVVL